MKIVLIAMTAASIAFLFPKQVTTIENTNDWSSQSIENSLAFRKSTMPEIIKLNNAAIQGATDDGYNLTFVNSTGFIGFQ